VLGPAPVQHEIAAKAAVLAYAPSRLAPGWHYASWTSAGGALTIVFRNRAGQEVDFGARRFGGDCLLGKQKFFQMAGVKTYWNETPTRQQAWRCVNGTKLTASTSLAPHRFADVGLARLVASGHRLRR
jgi:hypothetical protein